MDVISIGSHVHCLQWLWTNLTPSDLIKHIILFLGYSHNFWLIFWIWGKFRA
jgi:hypothetical protein